MTTTSNTSSPEQVFLATLQECLQTDNEKRTAAEVNQYIYIFILIFKFLFFLIRRFIKVYPMKKNLFYLWVYWVI